MLPKLSTNRHISRFLAAPPNPDSILREATIHPLPERLQEITDGLDPEHSFNANLNPTQAQGSHLPTLPLTMHDIESDILIAVVGITGNTHTHLKPAVY